MRLTSYRTAPPRINLFLGLLTALSNGGQGSNLLQEHQLPYILETEARTQSWTLAAATRSSVRNSDARQAVFPSYDGSLVCVPVALCP